MFSLDVIGVEGGSVKIVEGGGVRVVEGGSVDGDGVMAVRVVFSGDSGSSLPLEYPTGC